ncbi:PPPDE putative peptidase domain protein [Cryptosporidium meleagridis]|uniref:PPPDE putative peptidase domain protein n=1 Tax=Cryptosporidium meleagridis TaxID=93969 RepID=A0A2P4YW55_9CRYT|nr:PPPDE putative peptidase domain protein [Cryptosporidium meleagridis]
MSDIVEKVELHIYDLSNGMASQLSPMLLGRTIEAIYHTGVFVYGYEYFYGGGIVCVRPEEITRLYGLKPIRTLTLGTTKKSQKELNSHLESISNEFNSDNYDLLNHNCNHFSDNIVKFLIGEGIPSYILDLPNEVMRTPFGSMILPMLQKAQKSQAIRSVANVWNTNGINPSNVINKTAEEFSYLSSGSSSTGSSRASHHSGSSDSISEFSKKLSIVSNKYGWQCQRVLETLETILFNIISNPNDLRYRNIKSTSNTLKSVLMSIDEGLELLFLVGFREKQAEDQLRYEIQLSQPLNREERQQLEAQINLVRRTLSSLGMASEKGTQESECPESKASNGSKSGSTIDYVKLLAEVKGMGFEDNKKILQALHKTNGDISRTVSILLDEQSQ